MKNSTKVLSFLVIGIAMLNFSVIPAKAKIHAIKQTEKVSAPTIIDVNQYSIQNKNKPFITGLTEKNTDVMVYIDGNYVENASINTNQTETKTNNFYYYPNKQLAAGKHEVMLIAKDRTSLVLSAPTKSFDFVIQSLPAPTLAAVLNFSLIGNPKPTITGLTKSGTMAHIYIDGVYNGKTGYLNHNSGTANFAYKPFLNLKPGWHSVQVRAEDSFGIKSEMSKEMRFLVEHPYPAPKAMKPVVNETTTYDRPYIVGLAKNDSTIRIFIDKKLVEEFKIKNHASGTASFAVKSPVLTEGKHLVYITAVDHRGKESSWSNLVYFDIVKPQPVIDEISADDDGDKKPADKTVETDKKSITDAIITDRIINDKKTDDKGKIVDGVNEGDDKKDDDKKTETGDKDLDAILNPTDDSNNDDGGLMNEANNNQGKLEWNLIIFLLFLAAVIAWIFWVNRELIKERREKEKNDPENK
jgi:hypothetical protein